MKSIEKFFIFSILFATLLILPFNEDVKAQNSAITIPEWIKTTSGWWAEGQVTDKEFVDGIEFMVKNEFIKSPTIKVISGAESSQTENKGDIIVPEWIKNNASWWAEGKIGDSEFVAGIEFMVKNGFISSPNISIIDPKTPKDSKEQPSEPKQEIPQEAPPKFQPIERSNQEVEPGPGFEVLIINGKSYPIVQFWSSETSKCDDQEVWRTDTGKAIDVDGNSLDEGTDGCRFGLVEEIKRDRAQMTQAQITKFEELTGLKLE